MEDHGPGYDYTESKSLKRRMWWYRFENRYGFAFGPLIFFVGIVIVATMFKG